MKKLIYLLLFCLSAHLMRAQVVDSTTHLQQFRLAFRLMKGTKMEQNEDSAFAILRRLSLTGDPKTLNAVGNCYAKGIGTEKSPTEAMNYYQLAAEAGYVKAHYNLAMMYKYGDGVEMDYTRALEELRKCEDLGYDRSCYGIGYFYYKGLGVEQNYQAAVDWFRKGIERMESTSCRYMLGLCYRNGYGVERDMDLARELILKSTEKGHPLAMMEMEEALSEVEEGSVETSLSMSRDSLESLPAYHGGFSYGGVWQGIKITYDYSEQFIIRKQLVTIDLSNEGNYISGLWNQDSLGIEIEGTVSEDALYLLKQNYQSKVRYDRRVRLSIEQARLRPRVLDNGLAVLSGKISEYNSSYAEPAHPAYLIVVQSEVAQDTEEFSVEGFTEEDIHRVFDLERGLQVYPNPFSEEFYAGFTLLDRAKVTIELINLRGFVEEVLIENEVMEAGEFSFRGGRGVRRDTYLLRISVNGLKADGRLIVKI